MSFKIAVLKGDGIGPAVVNEAIKVLETVSKLQNFSFELTEGLIGGSAYDVCGTPLPDETIQVCKNSDAALLGAVGGPKWDSLPGNLRPETGLLGIRKALGLYANIRPAVLFSPLSDACPLKPEIMADGIDITVVRELTGGIYFGERGNSKGPNGIEAFDTERYSETEISRIAHVAFNIAETRKKRVCSIDKANVLETSKLWRAVVEDVSKSYPNVKLTHMLVDNAAMQLVRKPSQFDVILCSNMFGDILSDEAAMITGSIGILPSSSVGDGTFGLYEPIHGSAPDIAGLNRANPIATILSLAMLLKYSLNLPKAAECIEKSVENVLKHGFRTADLSSGLFISCSEMGDEICKELENICK